MSTVQRMRYCSLCDVYVDVAATAADQGNGFVWFEHEGGEGLWWYQARGLEALHDHVSWFHLDVS